MEDFAPWSLDQLFLGMAAATASVLLLAHSFERMLLTWNWAVDRYKNNLFGNIAAHEAITAVGRETLITGIEVAHEMGFEVLAANVDSLFVQKPDCSQPEDFKALMDEIFFRTGLMIAFEGICSWFAFQPAIQNPFVGAANRYFGKFSDGSLKVRGMAQRWSDTPGWIVKAEKERMGLLAEVADITKPEEYLQGAVGIVKRYWAELDAGCVPIEDLVCKTRLSRKPEEYKGNSVSAKAARQLAAAGKDVQVRQRLKCIYTYGKKTEIMAWNLPLTPDESHINKSRYKSQGVPPLGESRKNFPRISCP